MARKPAPKPAIAAAVPPSADPAPSGDAAGGVPVNSVEISRCPKCGSPERAHYANKRVLEASGVKDGRPYARVVWRRTRCLACGQVRDDKTFE